jgi:hypothetical protein
MAGAISQAAFCLAYAWLARRVPWPAAVAAGGTAFAVATVGLASIVLPRTALAAVVFAALVLALTGAAEALGPRLTGLLAPFPLYATILTVFAHALDGAAAAVSVLRGLLLGLFGFAAFFFVLASMLTAAGIAGAFAMALAVALALQGASLWLLRRGGSA